MPQTATRCDPATVPAPRAAARATALAAAAATMRRGADFLGNDGARVGLRPAMPGGRYCPRVTGNGLRELDRFLNLLIDAAMAADDRMTRPGQANTAVKYRMLAPADATAGADHRRLLALGRSRACLFYCDGVVRRPDRRGGATMTTGWADARGRLRVLRLGQRLHPAPGDLGDVARFYRRLADRIVAGVGMHDPARIADGER